MNTARFKVIHAGPLVTFQDGGRPGHMRFGVSPSGPMDRFSHSSANLAVGNHQSATCIEVSMGGLVLECLSGTLTVATAGGAFQIGFEELSETSGTVLTLQAGETLSIQPGKSGSWCYLAFAGDVCASKWLGQTATNALSGLGGGLLKSGQEITIQDCRIERERVGRIEPFSGRPSGDYVRVVLGPQDQHFSLEAKRLLLTSEFALTSAYDRMGVRLKGPSMAPDGSLSIPSEPILRGSIQVSGDGVSTVLLADHQTTGGYPKIATLVSVDFDTFVQMRPHEKVRFMAITPESAVKLARVHAIELRSYFESISKTKS